MGPRLVPCPTCDGFKTERAVRCRRCTNTRQRPPAPAVANGLRTLDHERQVDPMWRPPHMPPACPVCSGFGYVQGDEGERSDDVEYRRKVTSRPSTDHRPGRRLVAAAGRMLRERQTRAGGWHRCPSCSAHPGSVMTHQEWTRRRSDEPV